MKGQRCLRILVVDDHQDAADSLGQLLTLWGHAVTVVYDGPTALRAARAARPNFVLLEPGLRGTDGWELAQQLRAETDLAGVTVIALTCLGADTDRGRSDAAGILQHLLKPVEPDFLRRLCDAYAARYETAAS